MSYAEIIAKSCGEEEEEGEEEEGGEGEEGTASIHVSIFFVGMKKLSLNVYRGNLQPHNVKQY